MHRNLKIRLFIYFLWNSRSFEIYHHSKQGDWKSCVVSDEQEEHYAGKFREIFEKFDPFLNQDSDEDTDVEDEIEHEKRHAIEAWT